MNFQVNNSPLAGREGKFVTSRQIRERLYRELQSNVALRVEDTEEPDVMRVSGRGELHLTILIENMRREGYELAVSRPQVLTKIVEGVVHEPYEALTVDIDEDHQGAVMEALGERRAELADMSVDGNGRVRLEYRVPARGLIGFQGEFLTLTRGTGLISHIFDGFAPVKGEIPDRRNGVLISNENGEAVAYALFNLQERGRMFVSPGEKLYEGMIIGIHTPRQRSGRQSHQDQEAHQHPRGRQGRGDPADAADRADARVRGGIHRRRRAGRGDPGLDPHPQALPEGNRPQARLEERRRLRAARRARLRF